MINAYRSRSKYSVAGKITLGKSNEIKGITLFLKTKNIERKKYNDCDPMALHKRLWCRLLGEGIQL